MAVNANAIITLAEGKVFLGEAAATGTNDGTIEEMINSISTLIEIEVARKVVQQTVSSYRMDGNGKTYLMVPYVPLKSVTSVVVKDTRDDTTLETYTSFSVVNANTGRLMLTDGNVFPEGRDNVVLGMSVGFATTDYELAVFKEAAYLQLKNDYKRWESQEIGLMSRSLPDGSVTLTPPRGLLLQVLEMIRPYKLRSCG